MKFFDAEVIGHRGAKGRAQENTRSAFEWAINFGLQWVETDIRKSKDGKLVICHDSHLDGHHIAKTMKSDLLTLSQGKILELEELLDLFSPKLKFNLEIKDPSCLESVLGEVNRRNLWEDSFISSFHHPILLQGKQRYPQGRFAPLIASRPVSIKAFMQDFQGFNRIVADSDFVDFEMIETCRSLDVELFLFNVHDPELAKHMIQSGVRAIIVDRPDLFSGKNSGGVQS